MWGLAGAPAGPSALAGPAACQVTRILCFGIDAGVGCQGQDKGVGEVRLRCLCFSWGVDSPHTLGRLRAKVRGPGQESRVPGHWPDQTPPHPHNKMSGATPLQIGGGSWVVREGSKSDSKGPVRAGRHPHLPTSYNPPASGKAAGSNGRNGPVRSGKKREAVGTGLERKR